MPLLISVTGRWCGSNIKHYIVRYDVLRLHDVIQLHNVIQLQVSVIPCIITNQIRMCKGMAGLLVFSILCLCSV